MQTIIYCKQLSYGIHTFFLRTKSKEYYLFKQSYRKGVQDYFGRGVTIQKALDYSKTDNNSAIQRTMGKIPMYIRYLEKEYCVEILEQTKKRNKRKFYSYRMMCA